MQSIAALRIFAIVVVVAWCGRSAQAAEAVSRPAAEPAPHVSVTILATNVGDVHLHSTAGFATTEGEWSFSAWVEVDGRAFLFDTGWSPRNVLENATVLGIDLSVAEDLILSHHHPDHVGGLETLRTKLSKRNPKALSRIHVAQGIFASRPGPEGSERNPMRAMRERLEATGVTFIVYSHATEVMPQVWVTGPVPRPHNERNYPQGPKWVIEQNGEIVPDIIPESQSLVLVTPDGPIIISGCGHAGLINTLEYVKTKVSDQAPQAAIGGFHLYAASEEVLRWTSEAVAKRQLGYFLGSHCTGLECVYRIREHAGMDRAHARIGAIGTRYTSGQGIIPGNINR